MQTIRDGQHIDRFIPRELRGMFYRNPNPQAQYAQRNGYDPYGFKTNGLVLYLPLWALKNSGFHSVDAYKYVCAITGALWRPYGRLFDGDDLVTVTGVTSNRNIFNTPGGTLLAWINPTSDGGADQGRIFEWGVTHFRVGNELGGFIKLILRHNFDVALGVWSTTTALVPIGSTSFVGITYDNSNVANNPIFYLNGAVIATTEDITPADVKVDETTDLYVGNSAALTRGFVGRINEGWEYSKILPTSEILSMYNMTKWRYQ